MENVQYKDGKWTITYHSTATNRVEIETADMLVAADGAQSTIRRLTSPGVVPSYEQVVAWRGRVPADVSVDEEKEIDERIKKGLLVWYKMHGSQYIILSVFCLNHFDACVLTALRYGVPGFGNADDNDDMVIEWCWYHPYEQDTDRDLENVMTTFVDRGQHVKGGEAYAPLPPFLGSTFEPGAEHAVAILNLIQGKSDERELRSWQSGGTAQRLWSSKMAGWEGMGLPDTRT